MHSYFDRALNNKQYCDLVITCQGTTFDVHKNVVCTVSVFFEKVVNFTVAKVEFKIIANHDFHC
jgi:hypothetical protein